MIARIMCLLFGHAPGYWLNPIERKIDVSPNASMLARLNVPINQRLLVISKDERTLEFDICTRCGELVRAI